MTNEPLEVDAFLGDLESRLERLRALYDQWFSGIERCEPQVARKDVERRIATLRKQPMRNTALRFRFQTLLQRWTTYLTYWGRISRQIEEGTYRREIQRGKKARAAKEVAAPVEAAPAEVQEILAPQALPQQTPPAPTAAAPTAARPASTSAFALFLRSSAAKATVPPATPTVPPATATAPPPRRSSERPPRPKEPVVSAPAPSESARRRSVPPPRIEPKPTETPARTPALATKPPAPPLSPARKAPPPLPTARPQATAPPPPPKSPPALPSLPPKIPPPLPAAAAKASPDADLRRLYERYSDAQKKNNERPASFETVAKSVRDMEPKLREKYGKSVDFEVVVKDGKVGLKPVPKK